MLTKPPIGIIPREIYLEKTRLERHEEVVAAITRYMTAMQPVPIEWIHEHNQYVNEVRKKEEQLISARIRDTRYSEHCDEDQIQMTEFEKEIFYKINHQREIKGLKSLIYSTQQSENGLKYTSPRIEKFIQVGNLAFFYDNISGLNYYTVVGYNNSDEIVERFLKCKSKFTLLTESVECIDLGIVTFKVEGTETYITTLIQHNELPF